MTFTMNPGKKKMAERLSKETGFSVQSRNNKMFSYYSLWDGEHNWTYLFSANDVRRKANFIKYERA